MTRICAVASNLLLVLVLLAAACAPAAAPTPPPARAPTSPQAAATPTPAPQTTPQPRATAVAPTVAPAAPVPTQPKVEKPRYGGVLTNAKKLDAAHFDVHQDTTIQIQHVVAPVYSLLIQNDPLDETKIVPDLAERWETSPDGKGYTFYLRKGVKFHDGKPATSADVKANFDRILSPPKGIVIPFAALYPALDKVEAPDDYTIKISLKYPQAAFLDMVALPYMVMFPKHILDAKGDMKKDMVGSGPFKFKEYVRGVSVEVARNPDYFVSGRPYLDGIKTYVITDTAAMFSALRTGQIIMAGTSQLEVGPAELEVLKKEVPGIVAQVRAVPLLPSFVPNVKRKPWDDVRVRRAVSLAADRQGALKVLAQGLGELGGYNMPGLWGMPKEELLKMPGFRQPKDADLAEAKRLLAEAGYPKGFKVTIKPRQVKAMIDIAIYMKNELAKLGIEAAVEPVEAGAHKVLLLKGDFEATGFRDGSPGWDPDVIFGEYFVTGGGKNYGQWSDPKVDELFTRQSQSLDPVERRKLVSEMEKQALEGVPRVVLFWWSAFVVHWPQVRNYVMAGTVQHNQKLQDVWLAQ